ncbi:hypothetical protein QTP88_012566 [Uroleucon formosanum]
MNKHNYDLHIHSCKKRKITDNQSSNINKYLVITGPNIQTSNENQTPTSTINNVIDFQVLVPNTSADEQIVTKCKSPSETINNENNVLDFQVSVPSTSDAAVRVICEAQKTLQNARNKESDILFESLINEVNNYTKDNETFEFEDIKTKRSVGKKNYLDKKHMFHLNSINQYFNNDVIGIYKDLSLFSKRKIIEIQNNRNSMPEDSFEKLCAVYHTFLDHTEDEYEDDENLDEIFDFLKRRVMNPYNMDSTKTMFKTFQDSRLSGIFPTLNNSLLIALTLPVTSASTERSFSKLKLVNTRLQKTMSQERLEDFIMISCERDIEVQHEDILHNFAQQSTVLAKY